MKNAATKRAPQQPLSTSDATDFLIKYKEAWETHNADLAAGLFTRDAEYRQDPFGPAIVGREAIHDYWAGATGRQAEIFPTVTSSSSHKRSGAPACSTPFDGSILIYVHKEYELDDVAERYPADHYILVDDKLRILTAVKKIWGDRVTTVFPRQGHYALDEQLVSSFPPADRTINRIGELVDLDFRALVEGGAMQAGAAD